MNSEDVYNSIFRAIDCADARIEFLKKLSKKKKIGTLQRKAIELEIREIKEAAEILLDFNILLGRYSRAKNITQELSEELQDFFSL